LRTERETSGAGLAVASSIRYSLRKKSYTVAESSEKTQRRMKG
jgi:hypothetical protein